jgi:hypothetical protein
LFAGRKSDARPAVHTYTGSAARLIELGLVKDMAAPHRRTTVTITDGAGAAPGAPSTTLAQWLVNVNEDDEIRRYTTGVALWRLIGDAERRAVVARRLETALQLLSRAA